MKTSVLLLPVLLLLLATSVATAQPQSALPDCARNPDCATLFEQGKAQSGAGNLAEALRLYLRAYETEPDPDLLFSIARVLHKQGQTAEAVTYYQKFLTSASPAQEQRRKAQEYLDQLRPAGPSLGTSALTSRAPAQSGAQARPIYKKWWFWTILGAVAAAGIAGGIAGGVIASQCNPPQCFVFSAK